MSAMELLEIKHARELHTIALTHLAEKEKALSGSGMDEPPAKKTRASATKPKVTEELETASDDLDSALGTGDADDTLAEAVEAGAATITEDDLRTLVTSIVKAKGTAGKAKAIAVLKKHTVKNSALIKDITKGKHETVYKELKKI